MEKIYFKDNNLKDIKQKLSKTVFSKEKSLTESVEKIIKKVKKDKIRACINYTMMFDKVKLTKTSLVIDIKKAALPKINNLRFKKAVNNAVKNINAFHLRQLPKPFKLKIDKNSFLEERWQAIDRVGCYVPGGSAPLISTVMMTVIPARIAKVREIIVCTPPQKNGKVNPLMLYVCKKLKVNQILLLGGAQGVAALSYGLENFPPVQKIVGPGNKYVTEAKRQVYGDVDIDMLAGPSEVCIIADKFARPEFIAADLLSQLEHDPDAQGILVTDSKNIMQKVEKELVKQKNLLSRRAIIEGSLSNLKFIHINKLDNAFPIVDYLAPEHLEIMVNKPDKFAKYPFKAGAVFLGDYTPVAVGDFYGGTNHVLPTSRRASFSSPLSVYDFMRRVQFVSYSKDKLEKEAPFIEELAGMEELPAHKNSVSIRLKN